MYRNLQVMVPANYQQYQMAGDFFSAFHSIISHSLLHYTCMLSLIQNPLKGLNTFGNCLQQNIFSPQVFPCHQEVACLPKREVPAQQRTLSLGHSAAGTLSDTGTVVLAGKVLCVCSHSRSRFVSLGFKRARREQCPHRIIYAFYML